MFIRTLAITTLITLAVAGCGSSVEKPKAIGTGIDDMKRSPCACLELPLRSTSPEDLRALAEELS